VAGNGTTSESVGINVDGTGKAAMMVNPLGVATDPAGNIYVADDTRVRKISPSGVVTTIAGNGTRASVDGTGVNATFSSAFKLTLDGSGNLYVLDGQLIRKISPDGAVSSLAGQPNGTYGSADGNGTSASFNYPMAIVADASGNLYVADSQNNEIRKITPAGEVSTLAGSTTAGYADGAGQNARFNLPSALTIDASGNLYVGDFNNRSIRKITPDGIVSSITTPDQLIYFNIFNISIDKAGNIYGPNFITNDIVRISPSAKLSVFAGSGKLGYADGPAATARFNNSEDVAITASGDIIVADTYNYRIRRVGMGQN
jgi:streptogramin lyase